VECPQCGTAYIIRFPAAGRFVSVLETSDKLVQRLCPIVAGGVCVGSLYWTCITFGAVTIMQVKQRIQFCAFGQHWSHWQSSSSLAQLIEGAIKRSKVGLNGSKLK
jgi:hypothetical protein